MYAFAVRGDVEDTLERLLSALDGRAATVRTAAADGATAVDRAVDVGADTEYVVDDDGWSAEGTGPSIRDALDRLAPDHDYAAVVGEAPLPTVVVGEPVGESTTDAHRDEWLPGAAETIYEARAAAFDPDAAVEAIEGTEPYETLESLVAAVKRSQRADRSGAIATFTGRVRAKDGADDERTRYLEFEKYDDVAERRMRTIESELEKRDGVLDVRLHHRVGRIPDGEDIVFVVVLAGHRREAFRTVEDGIDRLKDEVPLFKKEVTDSETFWVHERDA